MAKFLSVWLSFYRANTTLPLAKRMVNSLDKTKLVFHHQLKHLQAQTPARAQFTQTISEIRRRFSSIRVKKPEGLSTLVEWVRLYQLTLQNIVEGRRQVMANPDLKLDDGQTVADKKNRLDRLLKLVTNKLGVK